MYRLSPTVVNRLLLAGICGLLAAPSLRAQTSVRTVKVLGAKDAVEIEVEASDRIVPQTQVLTGPDRLVVDFPNSVPSGQLRSQSVDRGGVKDVRVGLFQGKPPVTRIVLDLKTAQSYQIFPYGRTVIIKVMGGGQGASAAAGNLPSESATRPGLVVANYTTKAEPVSTASSAQPSSAQASSAQPTLEVSFHDGLLGIRASKVTLSQVLYAVQQRTGAEVSIASGAEQEQVVADIAPAPAPEVLARLLNGSRFNFLILSAANDPGKLDRVILSARAEGVVMPLPPPPVQEPTPVEDASAAPAQDNPALPTPKGAAEVKSPPPPENNAQNQ